MKAASRRMQRFSMIPIATKQFIQGKPSIQDEVIQGKPMINYPKIILNAGLLLTVSNEETHRILQNTLQALEETTLREILRIAGSNEVHRRFHRSGQTCQADLQKK